MSDKKIKIKQKQKRFFQFDFIINEACDVFRFFQRKRGKNKVNVKGSKKSMKNTMNSNKKTYQNEIITNNIVLYIEYTQMNKVDNCTFAAP